MWSTQGLEPRWQPNTITTLSNAGDDQTVTGDLAAETADGGRLSLQEAVILSQGSAAADTINFDASLAGGTVTLTSSLANVGDGLTINGDTNADTNADITIDANCNAGIVDVVSGGTLALESLTLTGSNGDSAVGVASAGTQSVTQSTLTDNTTNANGDAILSAGNVTLTDSTISGNTASNGGGVASSGTVTATNTTFHGKTVTGYGGGLANFNGTINLLNSTVTGNSAGSGGGGIDNYSGTLNLTNTIVLGNTGGNLYNPFGFTDNGGNITSGTAANVFANVTGGGGTLADNGGPVQTVALLDSASNPALDVGAAMFADARGAARFDVVGTGNEGSAFADSGAYELQCFAAGTLIATPSGEVAVETPTIGDGILTADSRHVPVQRLGHQSVAKANHSARMQPVRIRAGALGHDLPARDLTVTADHGMILDDLVINASAMVNGTTIDFVPLADLPDTFTVYHVETKTHEIILANGALTETFLDVAGRQAFANHDEYFAPYATERIIPEMNRPRIAAARLLPTVLKSRLGITDTLPTFDHAQSA